MSEIKAPPLRRTLEFVLDQAALAARAQNDDRIPLVISTETPYYQPELGAVEILDHAPDSVDLSRFERGIALMAVIRGHGEDHGRDGNAIQVGVVEDPALGDDRRLRGMARFSRSLAAQEVKQDVLDGIRRYVSPGYQIRRMRREGQGENGRPIVRATKWMPYEVTFVPVPADPEAMVGRSAGGEPQPIEIEEVTPVTVGRAASVGAPAIHLSRDGREAKERTVSENSGTTATDQGSVVNYTNSETGTTGTARWVQSPEQKEIETRMERAKRDERLKDVAALAELHSMEKMFLEKVQEGANPDDIQRAMVQKVRERDIARAKVNNPVVELTAKEQKKYSLVRAINAQIDGVECFETDISQQISRAIGQDPKGATSFFYPTSTRAGLYNAATVGAEILFDVPGSFIDQLRNKARVLQLGATYIGGLRDNITFPEQASAGTATWMAENSGSDVSDSNIVLTTKTLAPKTLMSTTSFSRQLTRQQNAAFDVEQLVRADLAAIHALAIDAACLTGGASNSPQGLFSNTNVQTYLIATNGAAPSYADMVAHEYMVKSSNANVSMMGYLTTPAIEATLKTTQKFATTNGEPVWTGGEEGQVNGYKAYSSNQVNKGITAGTSTTLAHAIYFGCWDQLYIGEWGAMEIIVDPYRLKKQGMIELTSFQMIGLMVRRPKAFVYSKSALAAAQFA